MKRILFCAKDLDYGGIEIGLINWLEKMNDCDYQIDLLLESKSGAFLEKVPKKVHIITYHSLKCKNRLLNKILKKINLCYWILKLKGKYDFVFSYTPYVYDFSVIGHHISKQNAIMGHTNYLQNYHGDYEKTKWYFKTFQYLKYQHVIFVSKEGKTVYNEMFPEIKNSMYIPNFLNDTNILNGSKENIEETLSEPYFINVSRHEEESKAISKIIEACAILDKKKLDFQLYLVGDGPDHEWYQKQTKKLHLEHKIHFLGYKKNPYPYLKKAIAYISSSNYEGGPIAAYESLILGIPVISTKVGTIQDDLKESGILVEHNTKDIANAMETMLKQKKKIKPFQVKKYNNQIKKSYQKLIGE